MMREPAPFRVLSLCGVFEPGFRGGGIVRALARIVDTVPEHIDLALVTHDRDLGAPGPYPGMSGRWVVRNRARVFYLDTRAPGQWWRLLREMRSGAPFDLLYLHSTWAPAFTIVPLVAWRFGVIRADRVLVSPHGEFSPGALGLKARKKRLFLRLWGPFLRTVDVLWHAYTEREAAEIRAVLPWAQVEVKAPQVGVPSEPLPAKPHDGPARLVFIGRISPKKNLHLVLDALRGVSVPVGLDIYGPLEDRRYWSRCESLISEVPPCVRVRYRGELKPADTRATFARYDAFVFPTLGENWGHVITESLSASCPVICSAETPWTMLLRSGAGVVVPELTADRLAEEIARVAAISPEERLRARQRAGAVYRSWRAEHDDTNVLEKVCCALRG